MGGTCPRGAMSWSLRRRCRALRSGERGAVAIEAALIFPIVLLLGIGIIEWSLVLRDQIELTSVARAGARSASSMVPDRSTPYQPVPFTEQVVDSMKQATSDLAPGSVQYVLVYDAGSSGLAGAPRTPDFGCGSSAACARYDWDPTAGGGTGAFVPTGGAWDGANINACLGDSTMTNVGVYLRADHSMLTGMFGSTKALSAFTVMRVEPQLAGRCGP